MKVKGRNEKIVLSQKSNPDEFFKNKEILITGGSGSIGQILTKILLDKYKIKGIRCYSRTEKLQWEMQQKFKGYTKIAYILGDIRNKHALSRAMNNVDYVIHTAALKQLPMAESNPFEAYDINVNGSKNVIDCAIDNNVKLVMYTNTDKSVLPINSYGYSKGLSERLFLKGGVYSGQRVKLSVCRYGNVAGSAGSIIPLFEKQLIENNYITITDKAMCRYWVNINNIANFILDKMAITNGNEIFIPKMKSLEVTKFARYLFPKAKFKYIGIKEGEKIHEDLLNEQESHNTQEFDDCYLISGNYYNKKSFILNTKIADRLTKKELFKIIGKLNEKKQY
jgi:UDP-N-acetylglucosamine 4,6-dehydratase